MQTASGQKFERVEVPNRTPTHVIHLRCENKGALTIAYKEKGSGRYKVGIAFCSPTDNFVRRIGARIAVDRMAGGQVLYENSSGFVLRELVSTLAEGSIGKLPWSVALRWTHFRDEFRVDLKRRSDCLSITSSHLNIKAPFLGAGWLGNTKPWLADFCESWLSQNPNQEKNP